MSGSEIGITGEEGEGGGADEGGKTGFQEGRPELRSNPKIRWLTNSLLFPGSIGVPEEESGGGLPADYPNLSDFSSMDMKTCAQTAR